MITILGDEPRAVKLIDEIIKIMAGFEDDVATASAIATRWTAFGPIGFANECDRAFAAVPGARVNFDLIDEHVLAYFLFLPGQFQVIRSPGNN
jgi:hypothetical protein